MFKRKGKKFIAVIVALLFSGVFTEVITAQITTTAGDFLIQPLYSFKNKTGKDPFEAVFKKENMPAAINLDIASFVLVGIAGDGEDVTALFKNEGGGDFGYKFREGKLYGENNLVIENITGEMNKNNEVVLVQGDKEITFTMREK